MQTFARKLPVYLMLVAASQLAPAATYTVTSAATGGGACTADSTTDLKCTLADAVALLASGDLIVFAPEVQGQTITGSYIVGTANVDPADPALYVSIDASPGGVVLDGGQAGTLLTVNPNAHLTLSHLTLQHGSGVNGGAVHVPYHGGSLNIDRCTIAHNTASVSGGGIHNEGYLWINDSTLYDNSAPDGGGIYSPAPYGSIVLVNSTVTANSASGSGGGIHSESAVIVRSDIIAGNSAPSGPDILNNTPPFYTALKSHGNNILGNDSGTNFTGSSPSDLIGTGAAPIDARFAPAGLASNGGATQTVALLPDSPAFKTGACDANPGPPHLDPSEFDQRDIPRSTPCTAGAYEMNDIFSDGFDVQ